MHEVTVRVPASTSNLGPGFDCLGVALRLYNQVTVAHGRGGRTNAMVTKAARLFFERADTVPFPFSAQMTDAIPRGRGLGSSATVRAGLLLGLNELAGRPLSKQGLFELCAAVEGHPDNAAPAVFGGFTVSRAREVQHYAVSPGLRFVLLVPGFEISTPAARKILPARVPRVEAVETCANACFITAAFASRNYERLAGAFGDRLHQPFRAKLIPFLPAVIAAAERAGALGGFLSGSGSTIAAITLRSAENVAKAMRRAIESRKAETIIVCADNEGAKIVRKN